MEALSIEEVFERERPDVVNHHAAQKSVPYSVENPHLFVGENGLVMSCEVV